MAKLIDLDALLNALAESIARKIRALVGDSSVSSTKRLFSVEDAAEYIGRTKVAVQHLIASGTIRPVRIDRRVQIDRCDLDQLIEDSKADD